MSFKGFHLINIVLNCHLRSYLYVFFYISDNNTENSHVPETREKKQEKIISKYV